MDTLNKLRIQSELKKYKKKLILKKLRLISLLFILFLINYFEVKHIHINPFLNVLFLFLLQFKLFFKLIKKSLYEIHILKQCIVLIKFELDDSSDKKLPNEIFRIFRS